MLETKLSKVLGTTKKHLTILNGLGITTVRDLLEYFPRTYTDERECVSVSEVKLDQVNVIKGKLTALNSRKSRGGMIIMEGIVSDGTGSVPVVWFNQKYLSQILRKGADYYFSGKLKYDNGRSIFKSPKVEAVSKNMLHVGRIVPVYHGTEGLNSTWLRGKINSVLGYAELFEDELPGWIRKELGLISIDKAIADIHFPSSQKDLKAARKRLAFEEIFGLQLKSIKRKKAWQKGAKGLSVARDDDAMKSLVDGLPFSLTGAQRRTLIEILKDMSGELPMLRLVQGDVGSGKTIVAVLAALNVVKAGYQVAFMVPTEVLAKQHYSKLKELFDGFGISVEILLGGVGDKKILHKALSKGEIDIVVGTHALIQEGVEFKKLGLAIVDEQHRFGVEQRKKLAANGTPHLLSMTATPIPRTLAMILYGDLDISLIDEVPSGRKPVVTRLVLEKKRNDAYKWIYDKVKEGDQVYVICPLVEDSDKLEEVKSVTAEFERLSKGAFKGLKIGLLHGRMSSQEKQDVMDDFKAGKIEVLVSTSVIEVGIDVPNATIMMIEGAERFGLSQLHQFRGRVGRGDKQSYCFLMPSKYTPEGMARLSALERTHSGFDLAEVDLQMRGPGEIYGVRQSGIPDLKIASFGDQELVRTAKEMAERYLADK
ncbi:MAG: ATP-dependent DNA helicase RecG [Patescibacteria group bacterium]|nr:ATP-dependent DNA helicase RecG [Patescibacteria group bacterium]